MTPRASNVLFGYWSHDIGGFSGAEVDSAHHTESPELFLRWLQVPSPPPYPPPPTSRHLDFSLLRLLPSFERIAATANSVFGPLARTGIP